MKFPIVRWAAKPRMRPMTADDARMPTATPRTAGMTRRADATPTNTIAPRIDCRRMR